MRLSRRLLASSVLPFLFCAFAAVSCGDTDAGSDGRKVVRLSHWWGDSRDQWEEMIAEFERTHPDIDVVQDVMSFNILKDKVLTQSAAGEHVGDLIPLEDWFAQELVQRDYFVDIAPWVQRDIPDSAIFAMSLGTFRHGTALRAFPIALGSYPLFYNKEIFIAAGEPFPDSTWTYDTLLAVAQRLTLDQNSDGKPDQWGFLLDNSGGFDGLVWSMGGAVLTPDLQRSAFNEPATRRALQFWVDLVRKYHVSPEPTSLMGSTSSGGSLKPFETGRFAMAMLGSHQVGRHVSFPWDIALPPKGDSGRKALRFAAAFGIPKTSKNPEAAWEFLRWIVMDMPPQHAARMFYGHVPNSRRLAGSKEFLESEPRISRQILVDLIDNYSFSYWRTKWYEFRDLGFLPQLDLMVRGEKSVDQAAADADRRINEVLGSREGK